MSVVPFVRHFGVQRQLLGDHVVRAPAETPGERVAGRNPIASDAVAFTEAVHVHAETHVHIGSQRPESYRTHFHRGKDGNRILVTQVYLRTALVHGMTLPFEHHPEQQPSIDAVHGLEIDQRTHVRRTVCGDGLRHGSEPRPHAEHQFARFDPSVLHLQFISLCLAEGPSKHDHADKNQNPNAYRTTPRRTHTHPPLMKKVHRNAFRVSHMARMIPSGNDWKSLQDAEGGNGLEAIQRIGRQNSLNPVQL